MIPSTASAARNTILALAAICALAFSTSASADDAPQLDVVRAAKIATDYLAHFGQDRPYIDSLTLERAALLSGRRAWVARWSTPIFADGKKEVGLRINLDGTLRILVQENPSKTPRRAVFGVDR